MAKGKRTEIRYKIRKNPEIPSDVGRRGGALSFGDFSLGEQRKSLAPMRHEPEEKYDLLGRETRNAAGLPPHF
ncbi:MAG TPA: hypothetical protein ENK26_01540 [Gammaproteobacteria bacterium]|nr:hypothetical protein [Gammaproteobacteria bacterium]